MPRDGVTSGALRSFGVLRAWSTLGSLPRHPRTMLTYDASLAWAAILLLAIGLVMVYSSSIAYFIVFPALALALLVALGVRPELAPFRVLCLAVATDYVVSLPWFLFFPVPERWAYPESNAVLLSDQWTSMLIQSIRPLSGLNNSFPSTHTSLTVILVLVSWLFDVRWRATVTALGTMVILATFVLGIHWVPDILAGVAAGALSVAVAWRCTDTSERPQLADLEGVSPLRWKPRPRTARAFTTVGAAISGSWPIRGSM